MPAQPRGTCAFCGFETTKGSMAKHIAACPQRLAQAATKKDATQLLLYLRAQDAYDRRFWLDLEVRGTAKLADIDTYLRAIWLECCGHLSMFTPGGWDNEIAVSRQAKQVFSARPQITHIYDFGTSSETNLKLISTREGAPLTKHPIVLLARNLLPANSCIECGKPASFFCEECVVEDNSTGALCAEHAKTHPHEDYGEPIEIVNSPRLGMCGYTGPAEPPY